MFPIQIPVTASGWGHHRLQQLKVSLSGSRNTQLRVGSPGEPKCFRISQREGLLKRAHPRGFRPIGLARDPCTCVFNKLPGATEALVTDHTRNRSGLGDSSSVTSLTKLESTMDLPGEPLASPGLFLHLEMCMTPECSSNAALPEQCFSHLAQGIIWKACGNRFRASSCLLVSTGVRWAQDTGGWGTLVLPRGPL